MIGNSVPVNSEAETGSSEVDCNCDYGEARQCELHAGFRGSAVLDFREGPCEHCAGDGGGEEVVGHDPNGPVTHSWKCGVCNGTGRRLYIVEAITMEDLDDARD